MIEDVLREIDVTANTYYRWRKKIKLDDEAALTADIIRLASQ